MMIFDSTKKSIYLTNAGYKNRRSDVYLNEIPDINCENIHNSIQFRPDSFFFVL